MLISVECRHSCLHSAFWHFIDVVKAEGMTEKIREGGWENIRTAEIYDIFTVSMGHIYVMPIAPLFQIYPERLNCKHLIETE